MNVGIALTIDRMARYPDGIAGRVLNTRPIRFIGVLSYSLYLWQQIFLDRTATGWLQAFPVNLLAVGVAACLSYYVVERPFLAFKQRFSKV
jgi:peptidoglycan/LPS O-acetylase OafA/YrhL